MGEGDAGSGACFQGTWGPAEPLDCTAFRDEACWVGSFGPMLWKTHAMENRGGRGDLYQFQLGIGIFPAILFETATHSFAILMIPFPNPVGLRQRRLGC